ncbi:MAG: hypothetical protein V4598_02480 [Bdellovibrionota bacterium]
MKYILVAVLLSSFAHAEDADKYPEFEVGSPKDCVVLEKTEDQKKLGPQHDLQQMITDCLSPDEESSKTEAKPSEVVSQ